MTIRREWESGDAVELDLPMPAERIYANPKVKADVGRVALRRGPLVYCLEQADNTEGPVSLLRLPRHGKIEARRADLLGGILAIGAEGGKADAEPWPGLYGREPSATAPARLTAVPYYLWNNRGPNAMTVWIPEV